MTNTMCIHGKAIYERCLECEEGLKRGEHGGFVRADSPPSKDKLTDVDLDALIRAYNAGGIAHGFVPEVYRCLVELKQMRNSPEPAAPIQQAARAFVAALDADAIAELVSTRGYQAEWNVLCGALRTAHEPSARHCTSGCEKPICGRFSEQDDGEGRVDTYCAECGHTRECHETIATQPPEARLPDSLDEIRARNQHAAERGNLTQAEFDTAWLLNYSAQPPCAECERLRTGLQLIVKDEHRLMSIAARGAAESILSGKPIYSTATKGEG